MTTTILAFAGSSRRGSFNQRVLQIAIAGAKAAGASVTHVDLRDLGLPLYDGDLEAEHGLPEAARRFQNLLAEYRGLLIASPEYNSGYSPLLKNAIDWASRPGGDLPGLGAFRDKTAALVSASPGKLGGLRSLTAVRDLLMNIRVQVLPTMVASGGLKDDSFDAAGKLLDADQQAKIEGVGRALVEALGPRP
jgi:chromate reductase